MGAMTQAEVLNLIQKRKKETDKWNAYVTLRSRGAREREQTNYIFGTVSLGRSRRNKLRKMGVKDEHMPKESVFVVLDGLCRKFIRKHRDVLGVPRNRRSRYMRDGIPFNSEMTK